VQQFDIIENNNPLTRSRYPFAVVLQHDRVPSASTVIVAPLTATNSALASSRLHPPINVAGRSFLVMTEELAAAHRRSLGRTVASAESERYAIIAAIDLCFTGI
jgi:mRNA-degrading endonuclease toxin of MazEF toxin-antitoxin module